MADLVFLSSIYPNACLYQIIVVRYQPRSPNPDVLPDSSLLPLEATK